MNSKARIGLAVAVGYVLGRRRKLRTALTLAAAVAAGRISGGGGQLVGRGLSALQGKPHLDKLGGRGTSLGVAGRAAATAAVGSGVDALSGRLRRKSEKLRHGAREMAQGAAPPEETAGPPDDQHPDRADGDAGGGAEGATAAVAQEDESADSTSAAPTDQAARPTRQRRR
ncbi:MAG TPA: hypothetical protein VGD43_19435 [Micromonospora sp.]